MRSFAVVVAVALVAGCGGGTPEHVTLTASPARALVDVPATVHVRGLHGGERVILKAEWTGFRGVQASSLTDLRADDHGAIDLRGFEGARFQWSMHTSAGDLFAVPTSGAQPARLALLHDGDVLARASFLRTVSAPGTTERDLTLKRDGIVGYFAVPRGATRHAAVVALGGSEGGMPIEIASMLAARGYPTLALAYFRAPGLPGELRRVPLEYFERGVRWLKRQPAVDPRRVTLLGGSRGGEAALLVAATFPGLVHSVVGLVPSSEVNESPVGRAPAWTLRGRPVPLEPIPVERIRGPVLVAGADRDSLWPSADYVDQIEQRLKEHRFRSFHEGLIYPGAGHDVSFLVPYLPQPDTREYGGSAAATARAQAQLWPRVLAFLRDR